MLKTMNGNTARVIGANELTNDIAASTGTFFNLNLRHNDRLFEHCATTATGRYASGSVRVNVTRVTRLANSHIWHSLDRRLFFVSICVCVLELFCSISDVSFIYSRILLVCLWSFFWILKSTFIFYAVIIIYTHTLFCIIIEIKNWEINNVWFKTWILLLFKFNLHFPSFYADIINIRKWMKRSTQFWNVIFELKWFM